MTAFTTGECARALLSFADALRNTGEFVAGVSEYLTRVEQLDELDKLGFDYFSDNSDGNPLGKWVEAEKERLSLSYSLKLQRLSRYQVLSLVSQETDPDKGMENYLKEIDAASFKGRLESAIEEATGEFQEALKNIKEYRDKENVDAIPKGMDQHLYGDSSTELSLPPQRKQQLNDVTRSNSAHMVAVLAVKYALDQVTKAGKLLASEGDIDDQCKKIKRGFDEANGEVHKLLHPVRSYLSSVLDRELTLVSLGESLDWQPGELACAAASYGRLTGKWEKDVRFGRAVSDLSKMVSSHGRFANLRHIHEQRDGGVRRMMGNAITLHAMAQLLGHARDSEIEIGLAESMLRFFADTRAKQACNVWSFSMMDILIPNSDADTSGSATYNDGLLQEVQKLLGLFKDETLPKALSESLARGLVKMLNQLVQAGPMDGNHKDIDEKIEAAWPKGKMEQGEKYSRLLNGLCLQKMFPKVIREIDVDRVVKRAASDKKGWGWEFSQPPLKTGLKATASAVMALAEINKMLDAHINHIILEHFSVKNKGEGLDANLTLDSLFYPDYGLRLAPDTMDSKLRDWIKENDCPGDNKKRIEEKDWPRKGIKRKESVAIILQRMRAHVSRVSLPKGCGSLWSLVLHGPAGTGKTTLVEALAATCDVPLVEVTPSDLVRRGEDNIEQRARTVFEALSMLTRAVILFDEFDPVLKRRDANNGNPLSVFSFLTPGMLPKLKDLHSGAKKRSVAYVLITNLIGGLDEAAVRQGRFDERLGIYPPDLLSRTGRFLDKISQQKDVTFNDSLWRRFVDVINTTRGKGMTALGRPGWFTPPKIVELKTPFGYVCSDMKKFDDLEPDDELKNVRGSGSAAVKEWLEWRWINAWDAKLSKAKEPTVENLRKVLGELESSSKSET